MERNRESRYTNLIGGAAEQGKQAKGREALAVKERLRKWGDCVVKDRGSYLGDLALPLKGRRACPQREVSRGRSSQRKAPRPSIESLS